MRTITYCAGVAAAAVAAGLSTAAVAADWPHFRGPSYDGTSAETAWSSDWPEHGPREAWRREVGPGASSIVVVGDRAVTMGNRDERDVVYCLDTATGRELWTYGYPCPLNKRQFEGGPAATPTIADGRVFTFSHDGRLHALSLTDGALLWSVDVTAAYGGAPPRWKYAGSPLVLGERVILDIGGRGNSTLALDAETGRKVWGVGDESAGYAAPIPYDGGRRLLLFKGTALIGRAAADGDALWGIPWKTQHDVNASSPFVQGDRLFVSSGYRSGRAAAFALRDGGSPRELWRNDRMKTKMSSCVPHGEHVYGVTEAGGALLCLSMATGEIAWQARGASGGGTIAAAGDRLLVMTDRGELHVVAADPAGHRELARTRALSKRTWVAPVLAHARIYCKDNSGNIVCYDVAP